MFSYNNMHQEVYEFLGEYLDSTKYREYGLKCEITHIVCEEMFRSYKGKGYSVEIAYDTPMFTNAECELALFHAKVMVESLQPTITEDSDVEEIHPTVKRFYKGISHLVPIV